MPAVRIVPVVVTQHVEMAAHLHCVRTVHAHAGHVRLAHLLRLDNRLAAHLDGLAIAGDAGVSICLQAMAEPGAGEMFAAAVGAIQRQDQALLMRLHALAARSPHLLRGLAAAFGWVDAGALQGVVNRALSSNDPFVRLTALSACSLHRVDPGLRRLITDVHPLVRARALRAAGELGCRDAVPACEVAIGDEDDEARFWAVWSRVLLGQRGGAVEALTRAATMQGHQALRALRLAIQAMSPDAAHGWLHRIASSGPTLRLQILGSGINGDPAYVPWLIRHMRDEAAARLAGEAFTLITGVDLAQADLESRPPDDFESGPNDDPDDPRVDMDDEDGLPWPDPQKVERWWGANSDRFANGGRYFMGRPVTWEHCVDILDRGYQRQRVLAAQYLCLLRPGTPLFNTSAPAWRQRRQLAQMS